MQMCCTEGVRLLEKNTEPGKEESVSLPDSRGSERSYSEFLSKAKGDTHTG